jgi:hypothetical protein
VRLLSATGYGTASWTCAEASTRLGAAASMTVVRATNAHRALASGI